MKKFNKELMIKAHKFTKMMMKWYENDGLDYKTELGIIIKELLNGHELELLLQIVSCTHINVKEWSKGDKHRLYFNEWVGKYSYGYGYWDKDKKEYSIKNKYTEQDSLYDIKF